MLWLWFVFHACQNYRPCMRIVNRRVSRAARTNAKHTHFVRLPLFAFARQASLIKQINAAFVQRWIDARGSSRSVPLPPRHMTLTTKQISPQSWMNQNLINGRTNIINGQPTTNDEMMAFHMTQPPAPHLLIRWMFCETNWLNHANLISKSAGHAIIIWEFRSINTIICR